MKLSRREWAGLAGVSVAAATAAGQTQPAAGAPPDPLQTARDNNKRLADTLAKFEIPLATEPAFQFKA